MKLRGRSIAADDRARILRALKQHHAEDFEALRTAALVHLAWCSALRLGECCALDVGQLVELGPAGGFKIRATGDVRRDQAKGGDEWTSAGQFVVTHPAREALGQYLREARRRRWLDLKLATAPAFIAARRHCRLTPRAARKAWMRVQARAGVVTPYRFHDLRHDAITRFAEACNGNPWKVAQYGRFDVSTAFHYVHGSIDAIGAVADRAARTG